jgi:hypothetical protein
LTEPKIEDRGEQPYMGIRGSVTMQEIDRFIDKSYPRVFGYMEEHGVKPAGPPFVRYNVIDMERLLRSKLASP